MDVAPLHSIDVLILDPFGCGAFGNRPDLVAELFAKHINEYSFETIKFAVWGREDDNNYQIFNKVLRESTDFKSIRGNHFVKSI